ncbi:MAG: putative DNA binding domain-containing protein [candidate division NC10 bacterium]|nr:putative DNA binding domain-containing protein [candidate division NC10 bacterium]
MYDTPDDLLREILAGEDSLLDWKEVAFKGNQVRLVPKGRHESDKALVELAKDLTCFANTEGGVIVFGVRKDGERVGVPAERMEALQQVIINAAQNNVEPPIGHLLTFDRMMLPDSSGRPRLCLKLEIKKALFTVHAPKGRRPYWRLGDRCHEMTLEQQARAFERRGLMLPFEERPIVTAATDDLDRGRFMTYCRARYGEGDEPSGEAMLRRMRNLKLLTADEAQHLWPTALGLLLFSAAPDQWISGAYTDLVVYAGREPDANAQRDAKVMRGPLVEQIERIMDYLRHSPHVPVAAEKDGTGRLDRPAYSLRALQEGVVNALVHRDFGLASQVRVFVLEDRIEISNPGMLHNTLTPEDLFAGCQPVRRNQMLAGFLRDYTSPLTGRAYMEARGEGFLTMVRECERVAGRRPEIRNIGGGVKLTIFAGGVRL